MKSHHHQVKLATKISIIRIASTNLRCDTKHFAGASEELKPSHLLRLSFRVLYPPDPLLADPGAALVIFRLLDLLPNDTQRLLQKRSGFLAVQSLESHSLDLDFARGPDDDFDGSVHDTPMSTSLIELLFISVGCFSAFPASKSQGKGFDAFVFNFAPRAAFCCFGQLSQEGIDRNAGG
jgi:hypothetical protein